MAIFRDFYQTKLHVERNINASNRRKNEFFQLQKKHLLFAVRPLVLFSGIFRARKNRRKKMAKKTMNKWCFLQITRGLCLETPQRRFFNLDVLPNMLPFVGKQYRRFIEDTNISLKLVCKHKNTLHKTKSIEVDVSLIAFSRQEKRKLAFYHVYHVKRRLKICYVFKKRHKKAPLQSLFARIQI